MKQLIWGRSKSRCQSFNFEDVYLKSYQTIKEARGGIEEYINIYNKERLHSSINYMTPDEAYYQNVNNNCFNDIDVLLGVYKWLE